MSQEEKVKASRKGVKGLGLEKAMTKLYIYNVGK